MKISSELKEKFDVIDIGFKVESIMITLILILGCCIMNIVCLCVIVDHLDEYENKEFKFSETYHIERLEVDTISSQEIEIFPLMDLDGNIVH